MGAVEERAARVRGAAGAHAALVRPVHEEAPRAARTAAPRQGEGAGGEGRRRPDARGVPLHCALTRGLQEWCAALLLLASAH